MLGKRLIKSGADAAGGFVPSEHFETVTYTGNGGTQRIGGYINRGAVFNGSSSYIRATGLGITGNTAFSVSTWINTTSSGLYFFFGDGDDSSLSTVLNASFFIQVKSNGTVNIGEMGFDVFASTTTVNDGNWHNIIFTSDGTNSTLYIDGTQSNTTTNTFNIGVDMLEIGRATSNYYYNGKVDQVRIFNKALSSGEVTTLYGETYASSTVSTTDIFNDNSGVALYQLDGNANDTGGVSGKFGSAAIFNGSSSYITYNSFLSNSSNNSDASFSVWVNFNSFNSGLNAISAFPSGVYAPFHLYVFYNSGTGAFAFERGYSGTVYYAGSYASALTKTVNTNEWYHIVYTYVASTKQVEIFVNGVSLGTDILDSTNTAQSIGTSLLLGGFNSSGNFNGKIDDFRIYSDVLTSTEVGYLYNNTTASIPTDNLVAYYKLDGDARDEQQLYDGTATNVTYAYNGTATNVTYQEATKFQPDMVWVKIRNLAYDHNIVDSVRGTTKYVRPNRDIAEVTQTDGILSFDSNGFTVGSGGDFGGNGNNYVAWCFKGGGSAVSNTDGTITSQVSANQDAGFSIVKYTANGTSGATIGHGLSQELDLLIVKSTNLAQAWNVYVKDVTNTDAKYLRLNQTDGILTTANPRFIVGNFSSTVFSVGNDNSTNGISGTDQYIAYCFHSVEGFSKIGSYTGTGAAGNTVVTGFQPKFVMIKNTASGYSWIITDSTRQTGKILYPNLSNAEFTVSTGITSFTSNGFILGTDVSHNNNGNTFIYLAIAADPDTTTPVVENSFDVVTYTGNGGTQDIATDFKPDLVWIKNRNNSVNSTYDHSLFDSIRGKFRVRSNSTEAENDYASHFGGINQNGFTVTSGLALNDSAGTYVAWCWKAGDHDDNLPQINTEGSINSVVSVNAAAGFSIVKYTSNGSYTSSDTIGHGLSQAPDLVIWKPYSGTTSDWFVQYQFVDGSVDYLLLNAADAKRDSASTYLFQSNVLVNYAGANGQNVIAYCFHSVSGYQKIGSYTGTGASGNSITTGFQPRWVMIKSTTTSPTNWVIVDSLRDNADEWLYANVADATFDDANTYTQFDSNGFTVNGTASYVNASGHTYIYLAIK